MTARWQLVLTAFAISCSSAAAWELPPDNGTMGKETIAAILAGNDYPETGGYRQSIDFIDFTAYGQKFTQTVVTLTPDRPLIRNGKKIVVVGGEPGSEYAMDFVRTVEDQGRRRGLARQARDHLRGTDARGTLEFPRPDQGRLLGIGAARPAHADLRSRPDRALDGE